MENVFTSAPRSNVHGVTLTAQKTSFPLLLRNRHAYRGAAYELPKQIHYSIKERKNKAISIFQVHIQT
jgi:hypothetical protein